MRNDTDTNEPTKVPQAQLGSQHTIPIAPTAPAEDQVRADSGKRTNGEQETAQELAREFRWVEFAQLMVNGVLAIIGVIALCIYYGQLPQMKKATEATGIAAGAARDSADFASDALDESKREFRTDHRPFMRAEARSALANGQMLAKVGETYQIFIAVDIYSAGRSPAFHVINTPSVIICGPAAEAKSKAKNFVPKYLVDEGTNVIFTGVTVATGTFRALTENEYKMVMDEKWSIYVLGSVKYEDMFGRDVTYQTDYCFRYRPTGMPFADCPFSHGVR